MSSYVEYATARIRQIEGALSRDARAQQRRWRYRVRRGRVWFDEEVRDAHKQLKQSIAAFLRDSSILSLLTTPIIYSLALPFVLLDLWVSVFQWTCFPIYGIARVRRRSYFVVDRHKLSYLNAIEKAHCVYCSYVNGLIAYVREIAARTEAYWCPIKHSRAIRAPHSQYRRFFDYGDAGGYHHGLRQVRRALAPSSSRAGRSHAKRRRLPHGL
jgi:hypothetical protein